MMEIQVVSVVLLLLVVVMVVDIHHPIIHIEQEDLVDLVVEARGIRMTVLLIMVVKVLRVELECLDKETLVDVEELPGGIVQVVSATWVVEAAVLALVVVMHNIQVTMVLHIHHHHILDQLGLDGEALAETAVLENQILLFHQEILQVMFPNPHFH